MIKQSLPSKQKGYIYGPVPSRRLGLSLGVDLVPRKLCTYDCVYCQLGKTTKKSVRRKATVNMRQFRREVATTLAENPGIDCISVAGSGEPTLSLDLASCARIIKKYTKKPLILITNGSLLYRDSVLKDVACFDVIIPSLDAVTPALFRAVNKPKLDISIDRVIKGLMLLRARFKGKVYLEIMLIRGVNDSVSESDALVRAVLLIRPDKVQINLPQRTPKSLRLMPSETAIRRLARKLRDRGIAVEIVGWGLKKQTLDHRLQTTDYRPRTIDQKSKNKDLKKRMRKQVMTALQRRPMTIGDLKAVTGLSQSALTRLLDELSRQVALRNANGYYRISADSD